MENFFKETKEKLEKNKKFVRNKNFDAIPDDEDLYFAVTDFLRRKNDEEIAMLPMTCQYVNAASIVTEMVYVTDFENVYTAYKHLVQLAIVGLFEIGELELAEVIRKSYRTYENSKGILDKYEQGILSWAQLLGLKLWEKSHEEFNRVYPCKDSASKGRYIRRNFRDFYDL